MSSSSLLTTTLLLCCIMPTYAVNTCNITKTGASGSNSHTELSLYQCYYSASSYDSSCHLDPFNVVVVERGETKDLDYIVNDYTMTAKYYGHETCVAYRQYSSKYVNGRTTVTNECMTDCFVEKTERAYNVELRCYPSGCVGRANRVKFVSVASSAVKVSALWAITVVFLITRGLKTLLV